MSDKTLAAIDLDRALHGLPGRIKEARVAHGWNQATLGKKSGVTQQHVNKLEAKASKNPSLTTIFKISRATGFSFAYLAFGIEPKMDAGLEALTRLRERDIEAAVVASVGELESDGSKMSGAQRHRLIARILAALDAAAAA